MANRKDIEFIEELVRRMTQGEITRKEMQDQIDEMLFDTMLQYVPTRGNLPIPPEHAFPRNVAHAETLPLSRWSGGPLRQLGEEPKHQTYEKEQWGVTGVTEHDYDPANDPEWEAHTANMRELYGPNWEEVVHKEFIEDGSLRRMQEGLDKILKEKRGEDKESVKSLFDDIEEEESLGGLLSFLVEKGPKAGMRLLGGLGMALYPSRVATDEEEMRELRRLRGY
jgi:hypothetical protein